MSDEGFHEIQLNGKQLVFLFMAATVVSVVIFLSGVMVGRGVRDRTTGAPAAADTAAPPAPATTAAEPPAARANTPAPAASSESAATTSTTPAQSAGVSPPAGQTPPTPAEDDDYYNTLVKDQKDTKVGEAKTRPPAAAVKMPERSPAKSSSTRPLPPAPAAVPDHPSTTSGYAVQLVAVRERSEADAIVKRLVSKGYQAYVLVPQPGKPPVYRVQVGRFKSRGDADRVASRLRQDEQFKPWVTR